MGHLRNHLWPLESDFLMRKSEKKGLNVSGRHSPILKFTYSESSHQIRQLGWNRIFGHFFNLTCLQDPCDATGFFSCQQKFKLENWSDAKNKNLYDRHNRALEHLSEWGLPWPRWHWCHSRWQCLELFSFSKTTGQIILCSGENRKAWKITIIDMDQ